MPAHPVRQGRYREDGPLPDGVIHYLRSYFKNIWPQPASWLFYGASPDEPMSAAALHRAFKKARERVGIAPCHSFHSLRHSAATHLLEHGGNIEVIRDALGASKRRHDPRLRARHRQDVRGPRPSPLGLPGPAQLNRRGARARRPWRGSSAAPAAPSVSAGKGASSAGRLKVMADIEACRTAVLGGHMYACGGCRREHPLYNSCRNRHCPTCQGLAANRWSEARAEDILPVPYFHVVFTLPKEIAAIAFCNRRVVFDILFKTVAETLRHHRRQIPATAACASAAPPSSTPGIRSSASIPICTWCCPTRASTSRAASGKTSSGTWLAPVKVLASFFRRRFLEELARAHGRGKLEFHGTVAHLANPGEFHATLAAARSRDWVVYAKRPFRGA